MDPYISEGEAGIRHFGQIGGVILLLFSTYFLCADEGDWGKSSRSRILVPRVQHDSNTTAFDKVYTLLVSIKLSWT